MKRLVCKKDIDSEELQRAFEKSQGIMITRECCSIFQELNNEQVGILIKAGVAYFEKRELYSGNDIALKTLFGVLKKVIDEDMLRYAVKCKENKLIAQDRWDKERATQK